MAWDGSDCQPATDCNTSSADDETLHSHSVHAYDGHVTLATKSGFIQTHFCCRCWIPSSIWTIRALPIIAVVHLVSWVPSASTRVMISASVTTCHLRLRRRSASLKRLAVACARSRESSALAAVRARPLIAVAGPVPRERRDRRRKARRASR